MNNIQLINLAFLAILLPLGCGLPWWLQRKAKASSAQRTAEPPLPATGKLAERLPPFSCAWALAYAGMVLFGGVVELLTGSVRGEWLLILFGVVAAGTAALAFGLNLFSSVEVRRLFRRIAAICAFVAAWPVIGFALFFLFALAQERGGWNPNPTEALVVPLTWLGAVLLPVCCWRLSRSKIVRGLGVALLVLASGVGLLMSVWAASHNRQVARQMDVRQQADLARLEQAAKEVEVAKGQLFFGPVIERFMPMDTEGLTDLLDLDTGKIIAAPKQPDVRQGLALLSTPALVIRRDEQKGETTLLGMNGVIPQESQADQWDEMTNRQALDTLRNNVSSQGVMVGASAQGNPPPTFLFKTATEKIGLLQITGFTENPRGVKIRYKLVQTTTSVNPPPSVKKTIFGPMLEFTLRDPIESRTNCFVDFEAGRLVVPPADLVLTNRAAVWEWTKAQDVDVIANTSDDSIRGLLGYDLVVVRLADEEWEQIADGKLGGEISKRQWSHSRFGGLPPMSQAVLTVNSVVTDPKPSKTYGFRTRKGTFGLLQFVDYNDSPRGWVKLRYKLMRNDARTSPARSITFNTSLAEAPKLQFLAWQDEWKPNKPFAAWHPDGSRVTNETELAWLKEVHPGGMDVSSLKLNPEPRFLHLWFSHPDFGPSQQANVALLHADGAPLKLGGQGSVAGSSQEPNPRNGEVGWKTWSLSPGDGTNIPARVMVQLRYTTGPLERVKEIAPGFSGMMSLEGDGQLNGIGQTGEGKAFVAFSVMSAQMQSRNMAAVAVTRDGRELSGSGNLSERSDGNGLRVQRYEFDVPLAEVATFRVGSRVVRTNEWNDVVLPGN